MKDEWIDVPSRMPEDGTIYEIVTEQRDIVIAVYDACDGEFKRDAYPGEILQATHYKPLSDLPPRPRLRGPFRGRAVEVRLGQSCTTEYTVVSCGGETRSLPLRASAGLAFVDWLNEMHAKEEMAVFRTCPGEAKCPRGAECDAIVPEECLVLREDDA